ncbi:MAG: site-2 protease family protein [Anaerolineae bacterium]
MRRGLEIGELFGIKVRVDWSWLLIFLLVTWNLATAFGNLHQDWSVPLRWSLGVFAALLFFASVLAHELAHSLVAQAQGMPVHSITLFLFGGIANIQKEPESPGKEFWMAIVGPLTSLAIGAALTLGVAFVSSLRVVSATEAVRSLGDLSPISTMLMWLGSINITLGIFNLIPGFPLDGGRVLRSLLWAAFGDLRRATRWAAYTGQGIAWLMIVGGIAMIFGARLPFFGSGVGSGLWLTFIGWFLHNASTQSYRQVVIQDILEDVPVTRMMREHPPTVGPDMSVNTLINEYIMKSDDHAFPVLADDALIGMVTLDDVRTVQHTDRATTTVQQIMTPLEAVITLSIHDSADKALMSLAQHDIRQLPVLNDQTELVGLLRRRDLVRWLQLQSEVDLKNPRS